MKIKQFLIGLYIRFKGSDFFLNRAIKKAKQLHLASSDSLHYRKRYRVFFLKNRYQVISRDDIQMRKHSKQYGWHVNSTNMQPLCFFDSKNL